MGGAFAILLDRNTPGCYILDNYDNRHSCQIGCLGVTVVFRRK